MIRAQNPTFVVRSLVLIVALVLFCGLTVQGCQGTSDDQAARPYKKAKGISGSLTSVGSDTLKNLMHEWAQGFARYYPEVNVQVVAKDSSAAVRSLIDGTSEIAMMSRLMDESEIKQFEEKFGYRPTPYAVALDALVLYVHRENPLQGLNIDQVNALFAKTPSYRRIPITTWGQLNLTGEWGKAPINLYGRQATSGTHEFVRTHLLKDGDFADSVQTRATSEAVVRAVADDRHGMGYGGIGSVMPGVRILSLAEFEYSPYVEPNFESVRSSRYPLRRYLYIYVNQQRRKILKGKKPLTPLIGEFLRYVYSQEGQADVTTHGYVTVEDWMIEHSLKKVG